MKRNQSQTNSDKSEEEDINMNNSLSSNFFISKEDDFEILSNNSSYDFDPNSNIPKKEELLSQKRKRDDTVSDDPSENIIVKNEKKQIHNESIPHAKLKRKSKFQFLFFLKISSPYPIFYNF